MCLARCPQSVDLPNLMLACRRAAEAQGIEPIGEVARFNQLFINGVREKGLSDEAVLAMRFNLKTGHFLQDALSAPKMVVRGMIGPTSKEQANSDEVKELIDAHVWPLPKTRLPLKRRHSHDVCLFPGCSAHSTGISYTNSYNYVALAADIDLAEIPNWNCCGES